MVSLRRIDSSFNRAVHRRCQHSCVEQRRFLVALIILTTISSSLVFHCVAQYAGDANDAYKEGMILRPPAEDAYRVNDVLQSSTTQLDYDSLIDYTKQKVILPIGSNIIYNNSQGDAVVDFHSSSSDEVNNTAPAYIKCNDAIEQSVGNDRFLTQEQYVKFLLTMYGNGTVVEFEKFSDLPNIFVLVFYSTACTGNTTSQSCGVGMTPLIDVSNTYASQTFCVQILKTMTTDITTSFRYSIRYNSTLISIDTLSRCFRQATDNLLYDRLAGCNSSDGNNNLTSSRRSLQSSTDTVVLSVSNLLLDHGSEEIYLKGSRLHRTVLSRTNEFHNDPSSNSLDYNSKCRYAIKTAVDAITSIRKF